MNAIAKIEDVRPAEEIKVRVGTPDDVHAVMDVALAAVEENGFANPNPVKLIAEIWAALNLVDGICGIVGEPGGLVEGVVLLRIGSSWYSDDKVLEEKSIFIRPEYRSAKGGRAARLVEFSKSTSDQLGIPLVIGILSSDRTKAKVRMYTRIFGEPHGAYWLYGVKTGQYDRKG